MTSAPRSARTIVQYGPARTVEQSITRRPASGPGAADGGAMAAIVASVHSGDDPTAAVVPRRLGAPPGRVPSDGWTRRHDATPRRRRAGHAVPRDAGPDLGQASTDRPLLP